MKRNHRPLIFLILFVFIVGCSKSDGPTDGPALSEDRALQKAIVNISRLEKFKKTTKPIKELVESELRNPSIVQRDKHLVKYLRGSPLDREALQLIFLEQRRLMKRRIFRIRNVQPLETTPTKGAHYCVTSVGSVSLEDPQSAMANVVSALTVSQGFDSYDLWPEHVLSRGPDVISVGSINRYDGPPIVPMGNYSVFRFKGRVKDFFPGVEFVSHESDHLRFLLVKGPGLTYIGGRGRVIFGGEQFELPSGKRHNPEAIYIDKSTKRKTQIGTVHVSFEPAELHQGPGLYTQVCGTVTKATNLKAITETDLWLEVEEENGLKGWIAKSWIAEEK